MRNIENLLELHTGLEAMMLDNCNHVSAKLCRAFVKLQGKVERELMTAPVECEADAADKLRFAAAIVALPGGQYVGEADMLQQAIGELSALRHRDSLRDFGRPHPDYAAC